MCGHSYGRVIVVEFRTSGKALPSRTLLGLSRLVSQNKLITSVLLGNVLILSLRRIIHDAYSSADVFRAAPPPHKHQSR